MPESLAKKLSQTSDLNDNEFSELILSDNFDGELRLLADNARRLYYGTDVYIRGLIEISNYCRNDCFYCGIRRSNRYVERYRLGKEEILSCCALGYKLGYRTFVLQGGEDNFYNDDWVCEIVSAIRGLYVDCAITLSIGEKSYQSYKAFFDAGANRYLLRHETANAEHYAKLHPPEMKIENRKRCLYDLKRIGYQVGSGFMVGSPDQTVRDLVADIRFLQQLEPSMIGIGPFISHSNTPFRNFKSGSLKLTLRLISILRLLFPYALIPSTTALGTIDPIGRELGILAGANVVMPNLSPSGVRKKYELYDNKICTGEEAAECRNCLNKRIESIGFKITTHIGNVKNKEINTQQNVIYQWNFLNR
ncbi:MAG: [FeFe] hydrogenase H-cluster radical SAM maturase HydE [Planctomycetaceae bacterium]|jgi:biotin synthase|nr:[FeFe] hydrogenase H-cluster radical SAM maturase HydE [Planctomycetaceae bacterium]